MLKKQVVFGALYYIRDHDGRFRVIRILDENPYGGYNATKLKTGRTIRIKSAAKLRARVQQNPETGKYFPVNPDGSVKQ